jgi:hypothetical protein
MEAQNISAWSSDCERRFVVFQLAVILAAAQHDSLHPGKDAAASSIFRKHDRRQGC